MNNSLFLWLLFLPLFAFGQQKETVTDSSWIANKSGTFYQVRYQLYSTGESVTSELPLGDTITTFKLFRDQIKNVAATLASDAVIVSEHRQKVSELTRFARTLPGILKRNVLDSIQAEQSNLFQNSGWTIRAGSTSAAFRFRQTAQGVFQWKADSTTNWRAAAFLGSVIRLNGLNGQTVDFYKNAKGRFITINGQYLIRQPGDVAARFTGDTPIESEPIPTPPPAPEFLKNGTVRVGELIYKYNSRKKIWEVK